MIAELTAEEIVRDKGYPGSDGVMLSGPRMFQPTRHLTEADLSEFWILDYRWSYGVTPLGYVMMEDGLAWGMQSTAYSTHVPTSNGQDIGMAGIHCYVAEVPQFNEDEEAERERQLDVFLPKFLDTFEDDWAAAAKMIESRAQSLERFDTAGKSLGELADYLEASRLHARRLWEAHFTYMYPLLVNYLGFCGFCDELGITTSDVPKFLQGRPSMVTEGDKALLNLAGRVKDGPLHQVFADSEAHELPEALAGAAGDGPAFLNEFDAYLDQWGWRNDDVGNPLQAHWRDDPSRALGTIKTLIAQGDIQDVDAELATSRGHRDAAIAAARGKLSGSEQATFDEALESLQAANFIWWNEDHNYYIDMRATIPLHRAAKSIGEALDLSDPADVCFLFFPELEAVARGDRKIGEFNGLIRDRRDYFEHWDDLRARMPKYLGEPPEVIADPIMIEMDGVTEEFLATIRDAGSATDVLSGTSGAAGTVQGKARVLLDADDIPSLGVGEILVCEGTTPSWTPAFAKIAGCVCDTGGSLSHAAVISREYGVPSVLGLAIATKAISDGDLIEVDGDRGRVTILERAA